MPSSEPADIVEGLRPVNSDATSSACGFLSLPVEIRLEIYRYLLSSKYIKRKRRYIKSQRLYESSGIETAYHTYHFYKEILRSNHAIYQEAVHVFHMENLFIRFTTNNSYLWHELWKLDDVLFLTLQDSAMSFSHCAAKINHHCRDSRDSVLWCERACTCRTLKFKTGLLVRDQLPLLLRMIRAHSKQECDEFPGGTFSVDICGNKFGNPAKWPAKTRPNPLPVSPHVRLLLDPFTLLCGVKCLRIKGTVNKEYIRSVVLSARKPEPTTTQIITTALAMRTRGDEAFHQGQYDRSLSLYQHAIGEVQVNHSPGIYTGTLNAIEFAGMSTECAMSLFMSRIQLKLAAAFVKVGEYERAAEYADLILDQISGPWTPGSDNAYKGATAYFWLGLADEGLGNVDQALVELQGAVELCPENEEFVKEYERLETKIEKQKMESRRYSLRKYKYKRCGLGEGL